MKLPFQLRTAYLGLTGLVILGTVLFMTFRPGMEGDTFALVDGAQKAIACVRAGSWGACPQAEPFTVFQYIPTWIIQLAGGSNGLALHLLSYFSVVACLLSFFVTWRLLSKRGAELGWLGILILVTGYWLRYLNMSFNEMLASFMVLMAVASLLSKRSLGWGALFLFVSALTKDTAFLFLLFWLWITILFVPELRRSLKDGLILSGAIGAGVLVDVAFNLFRFGTVFNRGYIDPSLIIHDPALQRSFFLAQWFSPSGGVWIFWMTFGVLLLSLSWIVVRASGWERRVPGVAVLLIFFGLTLGFSKWYCPLGGWCWGARLLLPWMPGMSLYAIWVYADRFKDLLRRWTGNRGMFWGLTSLLALMSFPQYAILFRNSLIGRVLEPVGCRGLTSFDFSNCVFWPPWPWGLFSFYRPFPRPDLFVLAALMSSWVFAISLKIRGLMRSI